MSQIKCPCEANKPCAQGHGVVLTEEEVRLCNGEGVSPAEQLEFIRDLGGGLILASRQEKLPSLTQQALNLGGAIVEHLVSGMKKADSNLYKKRIELCMACPAFLPSGRCQECGCFMKAKASWLEQKCPRGKW